MIPDFEDMLTLFDKHGVKYLVIGGLVFVFHVRPRYTKDMDVWVGCDPENLRKVNLALAEFGSPQLLDTDQADQVLPFFARKPCGLGRLWRRRRRVNLPQGGSAVAPKELWQDKMAFLASQGSAKMPRGLPRGASQVGVAPNRVDILTHVDGPVFENAWRRRIPATYGKAPVNWIDLDGLLDIKARIDDPRHQSDAKYLRKVKEMKKKAPLKKSGKVKTDN